eukprot:208399_1
MKSNAVRRRSKSAIKPKRPTRRSRRLSGLPPVSGLEDKENGPTPNIINNYVERQRNIKTSQKRNIFSSNIMNTSNINGKIYNDKQVESIQNVMKPNLNVAKTISIDENNFDTDSDHITNTPPIYIYNKQNEDSSENEPHEEEEKSAILMGKNTPKEKIQINKVQHKNKMELKQNDSNDYQLQITFIIFCIFCLHLISWLSIINSKIGWFEWYHNYIGFMVSFTLHTMCRYYYSIQMCGKDMER